MPLAGDDREPAAKQVARREPRPHPLVGQGRDGELDLSPLQGRLQLLMKAADELEPDLGECGMEVGRHQGQEHRGRRGAHADMQRPGGAASRLAHLVFGALDLRAHQLRARQQTRSLRRQPYTLRGTDQQGHAQRGLQGLEAARQTRLRHGQFARGTPEAAELDDRHEGTQLLKGHGES